MYKVGVVGTGYVGGTISSCFDLLLKDKVEIREHDKYKDSESLESVVNNSDIIFISVPTPMLDSGACDTSIVESVCEEMNFVAEKFKVIVIKSTIPPGSTQKLQEKYRKHTFVFSPEFLTEKRAFEDFLEQDRIILGYERIRYDEKNNALFCGKKGIDRLERLFLDFTKAQKISAKIVKCSSQEAEMLKYMTNCFLATKVSFCNEIYQICNAVSVDYNSVVNLLKLDKRIGDSHLAVPNYNDFGFGMSCIPKDLNSMIFFAKENGIDPLVLETVWTKNLMVRKNYDWELLPQVSGKYVKK